jgi:hypothetical protein
MFDASALVKSLVSLKIVSGDPIASLADKLPAARMSAGTYSTHFLGWGEYEERSTAGSMQ